MKFEVVENLILKTSNGNIELHKGQTIEIQPEKVTKLVGVGKIKPVTEEPQTTVDHYELAERMAIQGENCEPSQTQPFVTDSRMLVIPFSSDKKYHYWNGGQSVCATLKELGRCDLIDKYKSFYSN